MQEQVAEIVASLLQSTALQTEIDKYNALYSPAYALNVTDSSNGVHTLTIAQTVTLMPFAHVFLGEPPQDIPGPYPCAYVYHIVSEYPEKEQEDDIRHGHHKMCISIIQSAGIPDDAERKAGRVGKIVMKLLERNQYIFGQIPGAIGSSSLVAVESEVTGQHLSSVRVPYHLLFTVNMREVRNT